MADDGTQYFSIVVFFIMMRESLEASVIVAVLLQCLNRLMPKMKRQVWWGALVGISGSILVGVIFVAIYYVAKSLLFTGNAKYIFTGVIAYVAAFLITYLGFAMLRFMNLEAKWSRRLEGAAKEAAEEVNKTVSLAAAETLADKKNRLSVFILAAASVFREGVESVVFVAGVGANTPAQSIPIAAIVGIVVGCSVGAFVYYGGRRVKDFKIFFFLSTFLLFMIAAGQVSIGTSSLQQANLYGDFNNVFVNQRPWFNKPVWDTTRCCSIQSGGGNELFPLLRAIFGYTDSATPLELMLYGSYWLIAISITLYKWKSGTLFDADAKYKKQLARGEIQPVQQASGELPAIEMTDPKDVELGATRELGAAIKDVEQPQANPVYLDASAVPDQANVRNGRNGHI